jgi:hypothetical protein
MSAHRRPVGRPLVIACTASASVFFALPSVAGATHHLPRRDETASGTRRALETLLATANLAPGWAADPPPNPLHIISACRGRLDPNETDLVEVGTSSAFFNNGPNVLMQTVSVFRSLFDARAAWSRTIAASPMDCMRTTLAHDRITPDKGRTLASPRGVTAYRVIGHYAVRGQTVAMYFDQLLVRRGRVSTRVYLTSYMHPFSRSFELKLERALIQRLTIRTAGTPVA